MTSPLPDLPTAGDLTGNPSLIVGWRRGKGYDARFLAAHENTFAELTAIRDDCLAWFDAATARPYAAFGALEDDEYFYLDPTRATGDNADLSAGAFLELLTAKDDPPRLERQDFDRRFLFYALRWQLTTGGLAWFVRKTDARSTLQRGRRFFLYEDTLTTVRQPDLVLDDVVDLVVTPAGIFIRAERAARQLLSDTTLTKDALPQQLDGLGEILGGETRISAATRAAFAAAVDRRPSIAARVARFVAVYQGETLDVQTIRAVAVARTDEPDALVTPDGTLVAGEEKIDELLDVVEGRYFLDSISNEERRADRMSTRQRKTPPQRP